MMVSANIVRVLQDPEDDEALSQMLLAAAFPGIGFGMGVYVPLGTSFPVSGGVRNSTWPRAIRPIGRWRPTAWR